MRPAVFTPAELAELAAADAEIDAEPVSQAKRYESRRRDYEAKRAYREAKREKIAEARRAYYEANREKIAEAQRAYYEATREKIAEAKQAYRKANREKLAEAQRAYYKAYREANREKFAEIGAALRRWRLDHGLSQTEMGQLLGLGPGAVSFWERGEVPIDFDRIEAFCPQIMEAFR